MKDIQINPDFSHTRKIISGLEKNYKKYGYSYCPCRIDKIPDNICPCKEFLETKNCICGLFIMVK
jgi:ferredoxin-thioredoxin reductase catalytic subunit